MGFVMRILSMFEPKPSVTPRLTRLQTRRLERQSAAISVSPIRNPDDGHDQEPIGDLIHDPKTVPSELCTDPLRR
jgi:hypothetical protein